MTLVCLNPLKSTWRGNFGFRIISNAFLINEQKMYQHVLIEVRKRTGAHEKRSASTDFRPAQRVRLSLTVYQFNPS